MGTLNKNVIVFVRAGESEWNRKNLFCGWFDSELSKHGQKEAEDAANLLQDAGLKFDEAHTSVLKRSQKTLTTILDILKQPDIPVYTTWRLNDRHYGGLTGMNKSDAVKIYGEDQVRRWRRNYEISPPKITEVNPYFYRIIGDPVYNVGPSKEEFPYFESIRTAIDRTLGYWNEVIAPKVKEGRQILIVAGATNLRGIVREVDNIPIENLHDVSIPSGIPFMYELNDDLKPVSSLRYLADGGNVKSILDAEEEKVTEEKTTDESKMKKEKPTSASSSASDTLAKMKRLMRFKKSKTDTVEDEKLKATERETTVEDPVKVLGSFNITKKMDELTDISKASDATIESVKKIYDKFKAGENTKEDELSERTVSSSKEDEEKLRSERKPPKLIEIIQLKDDPIGSGKTVPIDKPETLLGYTPDEKLDKEKYIENLFKVPPIGGVDLAKPMVEVKENIILATTTNQTEKTTKRPLETTAVVEIKENVTQKAVADEEEIIRKKLQETAAMVEIKENVSQKTVADEKESTTKKPLETTAMVDIKENVVQKTVADEKESTTKKPPETTTTVEIKENLILKTTVDEKETIEKPVETTRTLVHKEEDSKSIERKTEMSAEEQAKKQKDSEPYQPAIPIDFSRNPFIAKSKIESPQISDDTSKRSEEKFDLKAAETKIGFDYEEQPQLNPPATTLTTSYLRETGVKQTPLIQHTDLMTKIQQDEEKIKIAEEKQKETISRPTTVQSGIKSNEVVKNVYDVIQETKAIIPTTEITTTDITPSATNKDETSTKVNENLRAAYDIMREVRIESRTAPRKKTSEADSSKSTTITDTTAATITDTNTTTVTETTALTTSDLTFDTRATLAGSNVAQFGSVASNETEAIRASKKETAPDQTTDTKEKE